MIARIRAAGRGHAFCARGQRLRAGGPDGLCEATASTSVAGAQQRLVAEIVTELDLVAAKSRRSGRGERRSKLHVTRAGPEPPAPVVAKPSDEGEANPRFVVTSLRATSARQVSYRRSTAPRRDENRIKSAAHLYASHLAATCGNSCACGSTQSYLLLCAAPHPAHTLPPAPMLGMLGNQSGTAPTDMSSQSRTVPTN